MQLIKKEIRYFGDREFRIYGIGDSHLGSIHHDKKAFQADIDRIAEDPYALWIGMGDFLDCINLNDKRFDPRTIAPELRDKLHDLVPSQMRMFIEAVKPIKDKCIGLLTGNHEETIVKKYYIDPVPAMAAELGVPYLGYQAMVRLTFVRVDEKNEKVRANNLICYVEHGSGGGRKAGGKINRIEDLAKYYDAQAYFMGHVHSRAVTMQPMASITSSGKPKLDLRTKAFVLTGSYLHSVQEGPDSYATVAGFGPSSIGCASINFRPMTGEIRAQL